MKREEEKSLSNKFVDNALKILDSHVITLVSTLRLVGLIDWSFTILAVAFVLIATVRIFYKFDPQRRATIDSILRRLVKAVIFHI